MAGSGNHICPVGLAGSLDSRFRRWFQNPEKLLRPHVKEGMTVLDFGCGPGFFSIAAACLVGPAGRVIAADLQEGMLEKVREKTEGTGFENIVTMHQCDPDRIGVSGPVDFVLLFYVVHEVPDARALFNEIEGILNPDGVVLLVEPWFHVSEKGFLETVQKAKNAGLIVDQKLKMIMNRAVLLRKGI